MATVDETRYHMENEIENVQTPHGSSMEEARERSNPDNEAPWAHVAADPLRGPWGIVEENRNLFNQTWRRRLRDEGRCHSEPLNAAFRRMPGPATGVFRSSAEPCESSKFQRSLPAPSEQGSEQVVTFQTRSSWSQNTRRSSSSKRFKDMLHDARELSSAWDAFALFGGMKDDIQTRKGCLTIAHPGSGAHLIWDLVGTALIFYDCIVIPVSVFEPPVFTAMLIMDWITLIFWSLNIPATLTVGYIKDGATIMDRKRIFWHYLRTWFLVDVAALVPDWIYSVQSLHDMGTAEYYKLSRVFRVQKTMRLLRLAKVRALLDTLRDLFDSEAKSIIANIISMLFLLLVINHFIACAWFLVSKLTGNADRDSWITHYNFDRASWGEKYLVSFHWSITQFTPSGMHVNPQNEIERVFALAVVIFALVGFSYVVGSITGSLAGLRSLSEEGQKELWKLRKFFRHHNVPLALSKRIRRYLEHAYYKAKESNIGNTPILKLLSDQMMDELAFFIHSESIISHPMFDFVKRNAIMILQRLCHKALQTQHLMTGEYLLIPGEKAEHMHFLESGGLIYKKNSEDSQHDIRANEEIITEQALWIDEWLHLGVGITTVESCVQSLHASQFESIVIMDPPMLELMGKYAAGYTDWMNRIPCDQLSDIVPIDVHKAECETFIPEIFPTNLRRSMSKLEVILSKMGKALMLSKSQDF